METKNTQTHVAIKATGLTKTFGTLTAVNNIDFTIERGEVVALLGPNGAGKSTTIEMMLGLQQPTAGTLTVLGQDPSTATSQGCINAMLQSGAMLEDQRVGRMLKLMAGLQGATHRLPDLLDEMDIADLMGRKVRQCSGGQRQKIRLAIALLSDPEIIVLDEPTAGMDPTARRAFWASMRLQAEEGRTILFATHYLEEAEQFAQRTIIMNKGTIVADGPTAIVRAQAASQHLSAVVDEQAWPQVHAQIKPLCPQGTEIAYNDGVLHMSGPDLRKPAIALLNNEIVTGVELTNASLEDTFATLTQAL